MWAFFGSISMWLLCLAAFKWLRGSFMWLLCPLWDLSAALGFHFCLQLCITALQLHLSFSAAFHSTFLAACLCLTSLQCFCDLLCSFMWLLCSFMWLVLQPYDTSLQLCITSLQFSNFLCAYVTSLRYMWLLCCYAARCDFVPALCDFVLQTLYDTFCALYTLLCSFSCTFSQPYVIFSAAVLNSV